MTNVTTSTTNQSHSDHRGWGDAWTTGALEGFAVGFGVDLRDRQIAGVDAHASMAPKTTPGTPTWRPPLS